MAPCLRKGLFFGHWYPMQSVIDTPGLPVKSNCSNLQCASPELNQYLTTFVQWADSIVITVKATDVANTLHPILFLDKQQLMKVTIVITFSDLYDGERNEPLISSVTEALKELNITVPIPVFIINYKCRTEDIECQVQYGDSQRDYFRNLNLLPLRPYQFSKDTPYSYLNNYNAKIVTNLLNEMVQYRHFYKNSKVSNTMEEHYFKSITNLYGDLDLENNFDDNEYLPCEWTNDCPSHTKWIAIVLSFFAPLLVSGTCIILIRKIQADKIKTSNTDTENGTCPEETLEMIFKKELSKINDIKTNTSSNARSPFSIRSTKSICSSISKTTEPLPDMINCNDSDSTITKSENEEDFISAAGFESTEEDNMSYFTADSVAL